MKVERVHPLRYDTRTTTRLYIVDWIEGFYNHHRIHLSIGFRTPVDAEGTLRAA